MITLGAVENIQWLEPAKHWRVTGVPARIELVGQDELFHCGWVLLRAKLLRDCRDYSAQLIAETEQQQYIYDVPVTLKGTVLELFELPQGVKRLFLQPMNALGTFTLTELSLTPVNRAKRLVRKWARVLPLLGRKQRQRRKRAGLRLYTPLIDLKRAYQIAGRFRASPLIPYPDWIGDFDQLLPRDEKKITRVIRSWRHPPSVQVLILGSETTESDAWQRSLASINSQLYAASAVALLPAPGDSLAALETLPGRYEVIEAQQRAHWLARLDATRSDTGQPRPDWLLTLSAGTQLAKHALFWFVAEGLAQPDRALLYCDHDYLDSQGLRVDPQFKPDWSVELLRATPYIGDTLAIRTERFVLSDLIRLSDTGAMQIRELLFRISEQVCAQAIHHIPAILCHQPLAAAPGSIDPEPDALVIEHLQRLGVKAEVRRTALGHNRIRYSLPSAPPLISIIVPTRDMLGHLQPCIESVLSSSSYPNFELLIVDNQSVEPQTLGYFESLAEQPRVRILRYDQPFNYSAINNFAVEQAQGEIICLLNNDTVVITPDWMEEMLGQLLQAEVGCVGAKLLFADGRVQHAGDTVGPGGCADHLHSKLERDEPGYMDRAILAQDLSAVTAACLLTHRDLYVSLGGLDEQNLAVAFNDVDYCLRVREAGKRVVFTPYAQLYHHESVSRGKDDNPEKIKRGKREADYMRQRWKHLMQHDPFYNPNLSYSRADFSLSHAPLVDKPW